MPPRKRAAPAPKAPPQPRRSKLAKENDITAEQEAEIKEAWSLFRVYGIDDFEDEREGMIPTSKVTMAMKALGIAPTSKTETQEFLSILDPEGNGYVAYDHFFELAAIQINSKSDEAKDEEVEKAYRLFTRGRENPIRLQDLRQVALTLKEDISDDVLKAMILEANGGSGLGQGVNIEQFKEVMVRAGVFT